jgi:hypothetical protein
MYSGYIEDLSGVYITSIREICSRSQAFGLANIESILSESQDMSSFWNNLYLASPEKFSCKLEDKVKGPSFSREVILCCTLKNHMNCEELDDEDLMRLLSFCANLKILEFPKINRLQFEVVFSVFVNLVHVDLSGSKVGPGAAEALKGLIFRNSALTSLDLKSCDLTDLGLGILIEPIDQSRITCLYLSFNELSIKSVAPLIEVVKRHPWLSIVELKNNLKRGDVVLYAKLKNELKKVKNNVKID